MSDNKKQTPLSALGEFGLIRRLTENIKLQNTGSLKGVGDDAAVLSFPDKKIDSEISYIAFTPVSGQTSTVYEIRFKLPSNNQDLKYRLGMDGDAIILLKQIDNSLTLPSEAVNQDENQSYVFVKPDNSNQLIKKNIITGIETDTTIEILEGLSENDQVVISK